MLRNALIQRLWQVKGEFVALEAHLRSVDRRGRVDLLPDILEVVQGDGEVTSQLSLVYDIGELEVWVLEMIDVLSEMLISLLKKHRVIAEIDQWFEYFKFSFGVGGIGAQVDEGLV